MAFIDRALLAEALPGYELGEDLGAGAFGVVVAGTHRRLGRSVAIKQLLAGSEEQEDMAARFLEEARVLAGFDHPHIVPIFDYVEHEGACLIVMERLTGGTLLSRMRAAGISSQKACGYALAVATALHYAHDQGILHRDVKPDNMMFSRDGVLKVTDFGLARVLGGSTMTRTGIVRGTPVYMAPEQAQGAQLSPATDVYALATVLYEVLAGRLPFPPVDNAQAVLFQHVYEEPKPLREVVPTIPDEIAQVIDGTLARDPADRPATASDFGEMLARAASQAWGQRFTEEVTPVLRAPLPAAGPDSPARSLTVGIAGRALVPASPGDETVISEAAAGPTAAEAARSDVVEKRRPRRLGWVLAAAGAAAAAAVGLAVAGGGGERSSDGRTQVAGAAASDAATDDDEQVVRGWLEAYNNGDDEKAAGSFAPGATVFAPSGSMVKLADTAAATEWNAGWGCGYDVAEPIVRKAGRELVVNAKFAVRTGYDCTEELGLGEEVALLIRVEDGKIAFWNFT